MACYQNWMASPAHQKLFSIAAKARYFGWLGLMALLFFGPWYYIGKKLDISTDSFQGGLLFLGMFFYPLTAMGLRFFPVKGAPVWLMVELSLFRGVLGVHMWKRIPTSAELEKLLVRSVHLAREFGIDTIRIQSPLFVRDDRTAIWGAKIERVLARNGLHTVTVTTVPPKPMWLPQALLFSLVRWLKNYDAEGKHLPQPQGITVLTAGFTLKV